MKCPTCPFCGNPPAFVLVGERQAFCGNDGCPALAWDPSVSMAENRREANSVDLPGVPGPNPPDVAEVLIGVALSPDGTCWKAVVRVDGVDHFGNSTYETEPEAHAAAEDVITLSQPIVHAVTGRMPFNNRRLDN